MTRRVLVVTLIAVHVSLLGFLALTQSPGVDETSQIASGILIWDYGSFELECDTPPLVRQVASLPAALCQGDATWIYNELPVGSFREHEYARLFVEYNPDNWHRLVVAGRLLLLPMSVLGAWSCYRWSERLFGTRGGLIALSLWCSSPSILAWSSIASTDAVGSSLGVTACYCYWQWLQSPRWRLALLSGLSLGFAELTTMTWLILFLLWPSTWLVREVAYRRGKNSKWQLAAMLVLGLVVTNLGYAFDGTFSSGSEHTFVSRHLSRVFSCSWLGGTLARIVPLPLPYDYVRGLDCRLRDWERSSVVRCDSEGSDSWGSCVVGVLTAVPCGTIVLLLIAATCIDHRSQTRHRAMQWVDLLALWGPAATVLLVAELRSAASGGLRCLILTFPFWIIWCGRSALWRWLDTRTPTLVVTTMVAWSVVSSLMVYPHSLSYSNEVSGGPHDEHALRMGGAMNSCQEMFRLRRWLRSHPHVVLPHVAVDSSLPLSSMGIVGNGPPPDATHGPVPGWHVVSGTILSSFPKRYGYFGECTPVSHVGYSVFIYHLSESTVSDLRRKLGLPPFRSACDSSLVAGLRLSGKFERRVHVALLTVDDSHLSATETEMSQCLLTSTSCDVNVVPCSEVRSGALAWADVLVVPGGQSNMQGAAIGSDGLGAIRRFVSAGGGYVGVCAGARLAGSGDKWALRLVNVQTTQEQRFAMGLGETNVANRGNGLVSVVMTGDGRMVFPRTFDTATIFFSGGPVFMTGTNFELPDYVPLALYRTEIATFPFQKGTMVHRPAIVATSYGHGRVILFGPHPETTPQTHPMLLEAVRACARIPQ